MSAALVAVLAGVVAAFALRGDPTGDPGRLSEPAIVLPPDMVLPTLSDATAEWGLDNLNLDPAVDMMAGGVAIADLDGDRAQDVAIANGDVAVVRWDPSAAAFGEPVTVEVGEAIGVTIADVDRDELPDLLIATATGADVILWGGPWLTSSDEPERTELAVPGASSGLLAGELSGDDRTDIVRLGRGNAEGPEPDVLWVADGDRSFRPQELPLADRFTLAGELVDADNDGLLDIWLTRDVGWARGGDSLLSRQGEPEGAWVDVAESLGTGLEIDGMGITVADLNGDLELDAYVSDLGDNEVLLGSPTGFTPTFETGAAHIRPVGAEADMVSSTWGTGAIDVNLDGVLDLIVTSGGFPVGSVTNKIEETQVAVAEPPAVLLGVGDGTFVDVWPQMGIDVDNVSRGMAIGDLDGDGDDDFIVIDRRGSVTAIRNDTSGATLSFELADSARIQGDCNERAGTIITVTTERGTYQRLVAAHGYASSHSKVVIVGNPTNGPAQVMLAGPGWESPPVQAPGAEVGNSDRRAGAIGCFSL